MTYAATSTNSNSNHATTAPHRKNAALRSNSLNRPLTSCSNSLRKARAKP